MSEYPNGQSATSAPGTGPSADSCWKSRSQNLGTLASQCTVPPPTTWGSSSTLPVYWTAETPTGRQVRGYTSGSGPGKLRTIMARLSLAKTVPIGPSPPRLEKWLGPFSNTTTCHPACASTIAAIEPPAPLPITTALLITAHPLQCAEELEHVSHDAGVVRRTGAVRPRDLIGGVAAGLDVAGEGDFLPAGQALVAAVFRGRVQTLDRVLEQQRRERTHRRHGKDLVLLRVAGLGEVAPGQLVQGGDALPVLLLPARQPPPPGDPGYRVEREKVRHQIGPGRVPVAPRTAREDQRHGAVERGAVQGAERAEHRVDVAGHVGLAGSRVAGFGRVVGGPGRDPRGRRLDHRRLMGGEETQGPGRRRRRRRRG